MTQVYVQVPGPSNVRKQLPCRDACAAGLGVHTGPTYSSLGGCCLYAVRSRNALAANGLACAVPSPSKHQAHHLSGRMKPRDPRAKCTASPTRAAVPAATAQSGSHPPGVPITHRHVSLSERKKYVMFSACMQGSRRGQQCRTPCHVLCHPYTKAYGKVTLLARFQFGEKVSWATHVMHSCDLRHVFISNRYTHTTNALGTYANTVSSGWQSKLQAPRLANPPNTYRAIGKLASARRGVHKCRPMHNHAGRQPDGHAGRYYSLAGPPYQDPNQAGQRADACTGGQQQAVNPPGAAPARATPHVPVPLPRCPRRGRSCPAGVCSPTPVQDGHFKRPGRPECVGSTYATPRKRTEYRYGTVKGVPNRT